MENGKDIDLTKREYYASLFMQMMIGHGMNKHSQIDELLKNPNNVAQWAVIFADALILELEREKY